MLAHYVEWHLRQALKPILFDLKAAAAPERTSIVAKAKRSKASDLHRTDDGLPVHDSRSLLQAHHHDAGRWRTGIRT